MLSLMSQKDQMTTMDDLGKEDYQATVNCRIPPGEPRCMGRRSPRMLCLVYHFCKAANSASFG